MQTYSYSYAVASNPVFYENSPLHVLFAGESQTKSGHAVGPKLYDYYLLHFVESGKGIFRTEQHTYQLEKNDFFLIHPGQLVSYTSDEEEPWRYRWSAFTGYLTEQVVQEAGLRVHQPVFHASDHNPIPGYLEQMQLAFYSRKSSSHLSALGYLYLIMGEAGNHLSDWSDPSGADSQIRRTVKQMVQYMSTQYAHPVSIEQMSEGLGYNRAYLSRIFKKETGVSPVTYLLKLRIDKSRQLLRERPELSVEQVAASVGLTDALYFSRQFKRFCGQSPTEYRNKVKQYPQP
ncbi:AraC family transcriptional regulator [Paenibacillus peoriae]|uniref:AraC family transcriptional regulator n=1 Tax=Paenibacillus peoriae TaxID=59893 RepID=UPI00026C5A88|nr:AraC family transcriptional regulator [Paenibacillus peoriae]MEC0182912.1 AraC family transcriptional regulator [Paenibacillus peoriae]